MENASKALIMAVSIILGIMIITFLFFVFGMLKNYNSKNIVKIEETETASFNKEFFKYYENGKDVIKVTVHDIISISNFVKENNLKYDVKEATQNSYYVTIDVYTKSEKIYNFEKINQDEYTNFLEQNKTFKCSEIRINKITKRVEYVKYEEV
ncbi:MAG: hypothetical protein J6D03_01325 [Clostridia bacterium]|nr:hypothetical protein [Clostridia bacterium]